MATYNWAYKPGVKNKYGINIQQSDDDVRPANAAYVALFGNDMTGNGSRKYPFRTIHAARFVSGCVILGSGVYREFYYPNSLSIMLIGDGDVTIDITAIADFLAGSFYDSSLYNLKFKGGQALSMYDFYRVDLQDCFFDGINCGGGQDGMYAGNRSNVKNCTLRYSDVGFSFNGMNGVSDRTGNTIIYSNIDFGLSQTGLYNITNTIFYRCNISFSQFPSFLDFCLFYECNFRFGNAPNQKRNVFYPDIPSGYGYVQYNNISDLRNAAVAAFGSSAHNLQNCIISDPLFNNFDIGDYSLSFASPAKNVSPLGTYIGANSIASPIKVRTDLTQGGFNWSTAINLNINDDSMTLIDSSQEASIETTVIVNSMGREISSLPVYGVNADRNGQYVDATRDLAQDTLNSSGSLVQGTPYLVEVGAIMYNGNVYQPGERVTTTSTTAFTTSTGGIVREILEAPQRHTVLARFSEGASNTVSSGVNLTQGYWYIVENSSITYNSRIYNVGEVFKSSDNSAFSGTGVIRLVMSTETYQHYEFGIKPTSNNVGDSRTGAIIRGNGDPAYVRGGLGVKELPINAKFIQLKYIIQVANLKP